VELPLVDGCRLDPAERADQAHRWRLVGSRARVLIAQPRRLVVELALDIDMTLVERALAIERGCCPQFELALDGRRLTVATADEPALAALAAAFS